MKHFSFDLLGRRSSNGRSKCDPSAPNKRRPNTSDKVHRRSKSHNPRDCAFAIFHKRVESSPFPRAPSDRTLEQHDWRLERWFLRFDKWQLKEETLMFDMETIRSFLTTERSTEPAFDILFSELNHRDAHQRRDERSTHSNGNAKEFLVFVGILDALFDDQSVFFHNFHEGLKRQTQRRNETTMRLWTNDEWKNSNTSFSRYFVLREERKVNVWKKTTEQQRR